MTILAAGGVLSCSMAATALAQSASNEKQSLGEAARSAREQKTSGAKPVKVWTDDTLPAASQTSAPASPAAATEDAQNQVSSSGHAASPAQNPQESAKLRGALNADLAAAKQQLADAEKGLDLLQRDFDLRRDQYYSNPDFQSDKSGKAVLDALETQIKDRQQEVQRFKDKVASLEEKMKALPPAPVSQEKPAKPQP